MRNQILLYITLLWSYGSFAQPYLSVRGDFSIDQRRGCRDLFVTVTNLNPGTDVILYQYEGKPSTVTANTSFNYTSTGNFWLYQYIQGPTGEKVDSIYVEILDPIIPEFELQSCNNNDVQVMINNFDYDLYEIDYGDGTIIQVPVNTFTPIHNYATPGTYVVTVTGLYTTANNRCGENSTSFSPVNQVQPASFNSLQTISSNSLVLEYTLAPNTVSSLEIALNGTSGYQLYKQLKSGTTRDTLTSLQLSNVYCFRIASHDACSNFKAYSNELCSITAQATTVNEAINLSWNTIYATNYSSTTVGRDGSPLINLTSQPLTYADSAIVCSNSYRYQIISTNSDGSQSISNELVETAISTTIPSPIVNVSTTISDNDINWIWQIPQDESAISYTIYEADGSLKGTTINNSFTTSYAEEAETCLKWTYINTCNITSPQSNVICPFTANYFLNADGSVEVNWSAYQGWQLGVQYYSVITYNQALVRIDSISVGNSLSFTDPLPTDNNQVSYYQVYAIPTETGIPESVSNLLYVERPPIIAIPNSFTPNNDNLNDLFIVQGKYIQSIEISIINRWGTVIYQTESNAWDGTLDGKKVSSGSYIYQIKVKDFADNEHIRTGTVLILDN